MAMLRRRESPTRRPGDLTDGPLEDLDISPPHEIDVSLTRDGVWTALDVAGVPAAIIGMDGHVAWCTDGFAGTVLRTVDQVIGQSLIEVLATTDRRTLSAALSTALSNAIAGVTTPQRIEIASRGDDGCRRTLSVSLGLTDAWQSRGAAVVFVHDVTPEIRARRERQRSTLDLMRMSTSDTLTGLPNRDKLKSFLGSSLRRAEREAVPFAVLFCELTGVSAIKELNGHAIADEVIVAAAGRLSSRLRPEDVLARLSSDQFVIVAESLRTSESAFVVAKRLIAAATEPIAAGDSSEVFGVGLDVGVLMAYGPEDAEELLTEADKAMINTDLRSANTALHPPTPPHTESGFARSANTAFHLKLNQA